MQASPRCCHSPLHDGGLSANDNKRSAERKHKKRLSCVPAPLDLEARLGLMATAFLSALAGDMAPYLAVIELRVTFVSRLPFQKRAIGLMPPMSSGKRVCCL